MSATRTRVFNVIDGERDYQEGKWGDKSAATIGEFVLYMEHYIADARTAETLGVLPQQGGYSLNSIRKIAALAVACMEQHGAPER